MWHIFYYLVGVVFLYVGAEMLIKGGVKVGMRLGISTLILAAVAVSYGECLPQVFVCTTASIHDKFEISLGAVIGSVIFNILFVIGICSFIRPIVFNRDIFKKDCFLLVILSILLFLFAVRIKITRMEGITLIATSVVYTFWRIRSLIQNQIIHEPVLGSKINCTGDFVKAFSFALLGVLLLYIGADLVISKCIKIAKKLSVSHAVIGVSLVAIGTSVSVFVTSLLATLRNKDDISFGSVLIPSVTNITFVVGVAAISSPCQLPFRSLVYRDLPMMIFATALFFIVGLIKRQFGRGIGSAFIAIYLIYLGFIFSW